MFKLYSKYYAGTNRLTFERDLSSKTHLLQLRNECHELCGFSTLELYRKKFSAKTLQVVFSGDTIVEPQHWGDMTLAFTWLRFIGKTKRANPTEPLYWLLIVKGHRTYRFLPTFAHRYIPQHNTHTDRNDRALLDYLASEKFGSHYDPASGIATFGPNSGQLNSDLAIIPASHLKRPEVAYFLERNPGYVNGDELVCLCEVSEDNMRPLAKRVFLSWLIRLFTWQQNYRTTTFATV